MAEATKEGRFQVIFGNRHALRQPLPDYAVLIVPLNDSWNDFGHRTRIEYRIRAGQNDVSARGFIGFLDQGANGTDRLRELIRELGDKTLPAGDRHHFFTMLPSMEEYRQLVRQLGADDAADALIAAKDLVALLEFRPSLNWLDLATRSNVFVLSFVRQSEAYFAFKNAGSLLRGLEFEELGHLSKSLHIHFQLAGIQNEHELKLNFDHTGILPKRMAVIIGKNGVGKSQTLGRIARAAIDGAGDLTDGEGHRPTINRLLAFAPTNEAEGVFPSDRRKRLLMSYHRFSMNRSRRARRNDYVSDLIIRVARSHQYIKERDRWDIFKDALKAIGAPEQISLVSGNSFVGLGELDRGSEQHRLESFGSIDVRKEPVRVVDGVGYALSSGELSFLKFAAQVSLHIENGSLLLLDEPETHLHPNFISRFVSLLDNLLSQTGSAAIIATHSVYFVREVFTDQVTVLRIESDKFVRSERPRLRTFGADVGAISFFVFGEDEPSQLAASLEKQLVAQQESWQAIYAKYKDELSLELLAAVRSAREDGDAG